MNDSADERGEGFGVAGSGFPVNERSAAGFWFMFIFYQWCSGMLCWRYTPSSRGASSPSVLRR